MHLFHKWDKWTQFARNEIFDGDAIQYFEKINSSGYKPSLMRVDLRQMRTCAVCGAVQYRKVSA